MRKFWASIGSLIFFVIAPGTLDGFLPWTFTRWQMKPAFFDLDQIRWAGIALIFLGLIPLVASFVRFVFEGLGTPAPIAPPQRLVVGGFYRHVRNPMYVGVVSVILGQALLLGDLGLLWYGAIVWLGFHLFVLVYEEPTLREIVRRALQNFLHQCSEMDSAVGTVEGLGEPERFRQSPHGALAPWRRYRSWVGTGASLGLPSPELARNVPRALLPEAMGNNLWHDT